MLMQNTYYRVALIAMLVFILGGLFLAGNSTSANTSFKEGTDHWVWPVVGEITDTFGTRHGRHMGLDIAAPYGTEAITVDEGIVNKSYYSNTYGHVVFIGHPNGLETVYAHLSKRNVDEGDKVKIGQKIGEVGSTGVSTGDHLHFEVHIGEWNYEKDNAIDPLTVLNEKKFLAAIDDEENEEQRKEMKLAAIEHIESVHSSAILINEEKGLIDDSIAVSNHHEQIETKEITIKPNQTLWDLANEYNVTVESIMKSNQLSSTLLVVGQKLVIEPKHKNKYIVEAGDSLLKISKEFGISVSELRELNNLTGDLIFPMQELVVKKE
ncbi:peptidoglycan DD-metalloendopeptidase family protein [Litchfieldia alkalitelluris]|uniref:peptidoglycan DD-metalloendopeptidase family protein n=1 Tax=Litchfieldia alkalitelluris TaxID=304268 RepID=UPI002E25BDD1